jgi:hypothetical protein
MQPSAQGWHGSAHLIGGPEGQVDKRSRGNNQLDAGRGDDQQLLSAGQVAPPLLRRHDSP